MTFAPFASLLLLGIAEVAAQEQSVVPTERVTRFVNIRSAPSADADDIGRLAPGESLPYFGSVPRWHEVRLDSGGSGFVSKSWTEVTPAPPAAGTDELRIHFLSTGAGTCTVVECPGADAPPMIVDCGSTGGRGDMALEREEAGQRGQDILARHGAAPNVVLSHGVTGRYHAVAAPAPAHPMHCNTTTDYDERQQSTTDRAEYITDLVGSITVTSNGRSPLRLTCEGAEGCDVEIAY